MCGSWHLDRSLRIPGRAPSGSRKLPRYKSYNAPVTKQAEARFSCSQMRNTAINLEASVKEKAEEKCVSLTGC